MSLFDPDARPIRKGKLGKPNEFGFVSQLAEVTENTKRGARGLILPASTEIGNPAEDTLLPGDGRRARAARDQGARGRARWRVQRRTDEHRARGPCSPKNVFIAGRQEPGSKRTQRRLRRYRTGAEGRISHLKRRYGLDRSRLKGDEGRQIWTEWSDPGLQHRHARRPGAVKHSQPLLRARATHYYEAAARVHSAAVSSLTSFSAASR